MRLELESGVVPGPVDDAGLASALRELGSGEGASSFAILSRSPEDYVQAAMHEGGCVVEKREGHAGAHYSAKRLSSPSVPQQQPRRWQFWRSAPQQDLFTCEEALEIFRSYRDGTPPSSWKWVKLGFFT